MPVKSSITGTAAATPSVYPKLLQAKVSGNVWLVTAPKTGVVVHVGRGAKDAHVGYTSSKLVESKLASFTDEVKLGS